jgi:hypothetical protein
MNWFYVGGAALYAVTLVALFWFLVAMKEDWIWNYYRPNPAGGYMDINDHRVEKPVFWRAWAWRVAMVPLVLVVLPVAIVCIVAWLFLFDTVLKRLISAEKHRWLEWKLGIKGKPLTIIGGDGSSKEQAVVIDTDDPRLGIRLEYLHIQGKHGPRDLAWKRNLQMKVRDGDRDYDVITIALPDGEKKTFWFDITAFVGRW